MVVDTSAIVAILLGEEGSEDFVRLLASDARCLMAAPTWLECAIVIMARLGPQGVDAMNALIEGAQIEVAPCDQGLSHVANRAWLEFGKGRHPAGLNFCDCFAYALARHLGEPLLFTGRDFALTDIAPALNISARPMDRS